MRRKLTAEKYDIKAEDRKLQRNMVMLRCNLRSSAFIWYSYHNHLLPSKCKYSFNTWLVSPQCYIYNKKKQKIIK